MQKSLGFFLLISISSLFSFSLLARSSEFKTCQSSKEYKTTYHFLISNDNVELDQQQIRDIADKVSMNCDNAAKRFIVTTRMLLAAGLDGKRALETGLELSRSNDEAFEMFSYAFERAYMRNYLDLTLLQSLELSLQVTKSLDGNLSVVKKSFNDIVSACLSRRIPFLTLQACGESAVEIGLLSSKFEERMGRNFIDFYEFLISSASGHPNLTHSDAIKVARETLIFGPKSSENFKRAYQFASDSNGLAKSRRDSINFAKKLAQRSLKKD